MYVYIKFLENSKLFDSINYIFVRFRYFNFVFKLKNCLLSFICLLKELFKALSDQVNHECLSTSAKKKQASFIANRVSRKTLSEISSIVFAQNMILITKMTAEEKSTYGEREYPYEKCL